MENKKVFDAIDKKKKELLEKQCKLISSTDKDLEFKSITYALTVLSSLENTLLKM